MSEPRIKTNDRSAVGPPPRLTHPPRNALILHRTSQELLTPCPKIYASPPSPHCLLRTPTTFHGRPPHELQAIFSFLQPLFGAYSDPFLCRTSTLFKRSCCHLRHLEGRDAGHGALGSSRPYADGNNWINARREER
ncbi:hypothetical protein E2C01_046412 [Portunus trituberculatus]|uniref:Uncharacterized protein n=1 Tax=Portunus trituberculatus TaxID=210409 RepID=A0A5B7FYD9_PORTR|nr:hypothetical protein [Portunus trituberculatus]